MTLKQMLLYLYGGVISLGSTCSLGRLIQVADMYSIDGLKEVVAFNLNMEYCHFFHRVSKKLHSVIIIKPVSC